MNLTIAFVLCIWLGLVRALHNATAVPSAQQTVTDSTSWQMILASTARPNQRNSSFCFVGYERFEDERFIPTDHPCHVCVCRYGRAECYWMDCAPAPEGCEIFLLQGRCNPQLYLCYIPADLADESRLKKNPLRVTPDFGAVPRLGPNGFEVTTMNASLAVLARNRRMLRRFKRDSLVAAAKQERTQGDCYVLGVPYKTGETMGIATSFCMHCRCVKQNMFCSPQCCFNAVNYYESIPSMMRRAKERGPPQRSPHPLYHLYHVL